jgi:hypothetical protein
VTGSRFLPAQERGASRKPSGGHRSTAYRRLGIAVFARVVSLLTRQRVTDPTSGFRMTDRIGIELFARDYPSDYPEVEAIVLAHTYALHTREVAVRMRPRTSGRSKISTSVSVYYLFKVLLAVFVSALRSAPADRAGTALGGGAVSLARGAAKTETTATYQRVGVIASPSSSSCSSSSWCAGAR